MKIGWMISIRIFNKVYLIYLSDLLTRSVNIFLKHLSETGKSINTTHQLMQHTVQVLIFAGTLFLLYLRYFKKQHFKPLDRQLTDDSVLDCQLLV